ncbi:MAG: heavy-metal-associated domain-containing protein [Rhodospirillales bacterium]|nr:heavy-metal-associated domain-containing protein [Rhodospirillales bacterium]
MPTTYNVSGMTCEGCANAVTKAIQAALPGAEVDVDLEAKKVTVNGAGDDGAVQKAVEEAGFEFGGAV